MFAYTAGIEPTLTHTGYKQLYEQSQQVIISLKKTIGEQQQILAQQK